jgi:N-acetylmuramoyl-L-alanine amidase
MSRSQDSATPERVRARRANRLGSDIILAFRINTEDEDCVFYFSSDLSKSAAGETLATAIASVTGGRVEGRAAPMLKETRAPSAVVSHRVVDAKLGESVARGLSVFFETIRS